MTEIRITDTLDVTGHKCPLPVLRMRRALEKLPAGAILKILASDPMTQVDFPHFCRQAGHELLAVAKNESVFIFLVQKARNGNNE